MVVKAELALKRAAADPLEYDAAVDEKRKVLVVGKSEAHCHDAFVL